MAERVLLWSERSGQAEVSLAVLGYRDPDARSADLSVRNWLRCALIGVVGEAEEWSSEIVLPYEELDRVSERLRSFSSGHLTAKSGDQVEVPGDRSDALVFVLKVSWLGRRVCAIRAVEYLDGRVRASVPTDLKPDKALRRWLIGVANVEQSFPRRVRETDTGSFEIL